MLGSKACHGANPNAARSLVHRSMRCGTAAMQRLPAAACGSRRRMSVRASAEAVTTATPGTASTPAASPPSLRELGRDDFYAYLEQNEDKLVVVDFYTAWCGPCKLMLPQLAEMAEELSERGVRVVKFNCNADNKALAKELAVKAVPTFHLYRGRSKVAEMTGAKVEKLRALVDTHMPTV